MDKFSTKVLEIPGGAGAISARGGLPVLTAPDQRGSMLDAHNTPAIAAQLEPLLRQRSLAAKA